MSNWLITYKILKKRIKQQKNDGDYEDVLDLLNEAESLIYKASFKLAEIQAKNE